MEDLKKKFVLLSKVAKEKKYAQEYLGLLARRGDMGSIRIGKRWYTTWDWFFEFEKDAKAKKEEMKMVEKIVETAKVSLAMKEKEEEKIMVATPERKSVEKIEDKKKASLQVVYPVQVKSIQKEKETVLPKTVKFESPFAKYPAPERKLKTINLRKKIENKAASSKRYSNISTSEKNVSKKNTQPVPSERSRIIENWISQAKDASPNFAPILSTERKSFFGKFAFSMSIVLLLVLVIQVGWVFRDELKSAVGMKSGIVAGAEDTNLNLTAIKSFFLGYLGNQEDKVRENISLSRVLVRAAIERESAKNQGVKGN